MLFDETLGIPTYLSLCSGYDGIGLGLKRVIPNLRTIAHVEIEAYAIANLISKMEAGQLDACPVFSDLKQFPFEQVRGRVGILSAGFPCQPFSSAGRRQSTEDPRHIYPFIADGISICRPRYVFLENVRGIVSAKTADGESVLKYVLGDLESRGYETEWGLFSAEETGAPHQRIRCFILAKLPHACGKGLQGGKLGGSCDEQVEGLQGTHESTSELHQVRHQQFPNSGNAKGYSTIEGCIRQSLGNPTGERPRGGRENCEGEQSEVLGERLESDELGNAEHDGSLATQDGRSTCEEQEEGRMQELEGGCKQSQDELANGKHKRFGRRPASRSSGVDGEGSKTTEEGQEGDGLRGETEGCCGESRELADSDCDEPTKERGDNGEVLEVSQVEGQELSPTLLGGESTQGGELAHPASREPRQSQARNGGQDTGGGSEEELGDTCIERCEQDSALRDKQQASGVEQIGGNRGSEDTRWPARPGEEQYEWEEPRVTEAQCELGGAVDGTQHRVDRLRLLGNGVVPQTAELAWKTLWKKMNK